MRVGAEVHGEQPGEVVLPGPDHVLVLAGTVPEVVGEVGAVPDGGGDHVGGLPGDGQDVLIGPVVGVWDRCHGDRGAVSALYW
jgi:hypothetical protein